MHSYVEQLISGYWSLAEEIILASMAAGVPLSKIRLVGPDVRHEGYKCSLVGGVFYV